MHIELTLPACMSFAYVTTPACCLQVHILLRQSAGPTDCLKAAFSAHVFLHMLDEEHNEQSQKAAAAAGGSHSSSSSSSGGNAQGTISLLASSSSSSVDAKASTSTSSSGGGRKGRWGWGRGKGGQSDASTQASSELAAAQPLTGADLVRETWNKLAVALPWGQDPGSDYYRRLLERSKCAVDSLYSDFSRQAEKQGWKLAATMLNPKESRVLKLTPLAAA